MYFFFLRRLRQRWSPYRRLLALVDMRRSLLRPVVYLGAIIVFHALAMIKFKGMSFGDGVWLTLTTMTILGYGDRVAETFWGRASATRRRAAAVCSAARCPMPTSMPLLSTS